jgi:hypothetical protein
LETRKQPQGLCRARQGEAAPLRHRQAPPGQGHVGGKEEFREREREREEREREREREKERKRGRERERERSSSRERGKEQAKRDRKKAKITTRRREGNDYRSLFCLPVSKARGGENEETRDNTK